MLAKRFASLLIVVGTLTFITVVVVGMVGEQLGVKEFIATVFNCLLLVAMGFVIDLLVRMNVYLKFAIKLDNLDIKC